MNIAAVAQGSVDVNAMAVAPEATGDGSFFQNVEQALSTMNQVSINDEQDAFDMAEVGSAVVSLIMNFYADGGNVLELQDAQMMADKILGSEAMLDLLSYNEVSLNDIFLSNLNGGVLSGKGSLEDKIQNMDFSQLIEAIQDELATDIDISKDMNQLIMKIMDEIKSGLNQNAKSAKLSEANSLFDVVGKIRVEQGQDSQEMNVNQLIADGNEKQLGIIEGQEDIYADDKHEEENGAAQGDIKGNGIGFGNVITDVTKAEITLEKPIESAGLASQVLELMEASISEGKDSLYIKLKPGFLGGIAIKLAASDEGVIAKIVADSEQTQQMLASQLNNLEASLKEKGIDVARMEVLYNPLNQDGQREGNAQQGQSRNGSRRFFGIDEVDDDATISYFRLMGEEEPEDGVYNA